MTPGARAVTRVLELAREHLGMDVAWLSRFEDDEQRFAAVSSRDGANAPEPGSAASLPGSYCVRVLDGRLPAVIPNSGAEPRARDLAVTRELGIGAYLGVPVRQRGGAVRGMLCCTSAASVPELHESHLRTLELLARLIEDVTDGAGEQRLDREQLQALVGGSGRRVVLQPICDLASGAAAGFEALTRFTLPPHRPDAWFARAAQAGLRADLELGAAASALDWLDRPELGGYLSVNLSPEVVLDERLGALLAGRDLSRLVLELTEHARVEDYDALLATLAPLRQAGLRVAVDDAGAGYASFGHILRLRPELIKADMSLTRDIDRDPVRQALMAALLTLARTAGARVIAEGVETQAELDTLARLGVPAAQGYLLGRPAERPAADAGVRVSAHVQQDAAVDLTMLLAEAVRQAADLESLARPLLDAVVRITGLETSYLTVLDQPAGRLEHRYVRNAGSIALPEGFSLPWSESLCQAMRSGDLLWTGRAGADLAECAAVEQFGLQTFLSIPVLDADEQLVGTLCAGSRQAVFVSDATLAQVQLVAHVLGGRFAGRR